MAKCGIKVATAQSGGWEIQLILGLVGVAMALEREMSTYEANVSGWVDHAGKFVLIHGEDVVDFFAAYEDALKAGYQKFGLDQFLVKQINTVGAAQYITRDIRPRSTVHA